MFFVCSWPVITIYFRIFSSISTYIRFSYSRFSMLISLFMTILAWPQCSYNIRFSFFTNTYVIQIVSKVSMFFMCSRSIFWINYCWLSTAITKIWLFFFRFSMRISSLRTIMTWTYCFWYFLFNSSTEITSFNVFI